MSDMDLDPNVLRELAMVVSSCGVWWQSMVDDDMAPQQLVDDIRLAAAYLKERADLLERPCPSFVRVLEAALDRAQAGESEASIREDYGWGQP